jgi:hypothetical protein
LNCGWTVHGSRQEKQNKNDFSNRPFFNWAHRIVGNLALTFGVIAIFLSFGFNAMNLPVPILYKLPWIFSISVSGGKIFEKFYSEFGQDFINKLHTKNRTKHIPRSVKMEPKK